MVEHHVADTDYTCQRCRMFVRARIPHECDPTICRKCNGTTTTWFHGWVKCDNCAGTGRITFDKGEDNAIGATI
jgi:hypothetical protein